MKILAPLDPDTLQGIREVLVDVLSVDMDELASQESNFYFDLGGESIDSLDLNFHIEKRWGIKLAAKSLADRIATFSVNEPIDVVNAALRSEFPDAIGIQLETADLANTKRLMTVGFIVYLVDCERARQNAA